MAKIVNADNFDGDYPNEKFVDGLPLLTESHAKSIAKAINDGFPDDFPRYFKVVPDDYILSPGFEP